MEDKRVAMLVVMMLVMGNMLIEAEAVMSFKLCYGGCLVACALIAPPIKKLFCPFLCIKDCKRRPMLSFEANLNEIDQTGSYCELGCATDRCVSSSSIDDKGKFVVFVFFSPSSCINNVHIYIQFNLVGLRILCKFLWSKNDDFVLGVILLLVRMFDGF